MEYITLHTTRSTVFTNEFYALCGIKTNNSDYSGVMMINFITVNASYFDLAGVVYTYCKECKEAITPMDLLNAVEL